MPFNRSAACLLAQPRVIKRVVALIVDASLCVLTVWLAFCLRLESWVMLSGKQWLVVAASLTFALPMFIVSGLYRAIFRYAGWAALMAVIRAIAVYGLLFAVVFMAVGVQSIPRTIGVIQPILLLLAVGASRATARYWLGGMYQNHLIRQTLPKVLIYGAGSAGRQLAAAMANSREMVVTGFLDDDARLRGSVLNGLTIYSPEYLKELVDSLQISDILLAIPSASRKRRNEILDLIRKAQVSVRTLPSLMDLAQGKVQISALRELDIEDLLGRDIVPPNPVLLGKNISKKVVLVTGAGGSIGSELCRQIIKVEPAILLLVDIGEYALYAIWQELQQRLANEDECNVQVVPLLASVCDEARMREIMSTWRPHTVYHAAAYKHVPLVEHNPAAGIKNNVFGSLMAARVAVEQNVSDFVLISTDKAVRPTNIMGASKRLAEMVLQAIAAEKEMSPSSNNLSMVKKEGMRTRFSMVRFGNVLGSSGSVVPLFRQQIKDGGPITLTHADITRYFMTIPEAAQLVIQAGAMASGGDVFVLDMGEPVKIIDLARRMVELSGLAVRDSEHPDGDIEIDIKGLRPGEKLYEELLIGENPLPTNHPRIMKAHEDFLPWAELEQRLQELSIALDVNDIPAIRVMLKQLVPGYQPEGKVVDWVYLEQMAEAEQKLKLSNDKLSSFSFLNHSTVLGTAAT